MKIFTTKEIFLSLIASALGLLVTELVYAQEQPKKEDPYAGQYERVQPPQPTSSKDKIEVVELFWYRCPHCYYLEKNDNFKNWLQNKPDDVVFTQMPAVFPNDKWIPLAKAYYTAEKLGVLTGLGGKDGLHLSLFKEIHDPPKRTMNNEGALQRLFVKHGVSQKDFTDTYNSFAVKTKIGQAESMTTRYGITGVPAIIVNGKYRLSSEKTGGYEKMMKVIDYLIDKERQLQATDTPTTK